MLKDLSEKMGTKKLLNTSSSPPIAYKRYCNNYEEAQEQQEQTPLKQQHYQQQQEQHSSGNHSNKTNINNTCLLVKHNTNAMFTKLRNYFTQFRPTKSTLSSASSSVSHCHQHRSYRHEKLTECNSIPIVQHSSSKMLHIVSIVVTLIFLASFNSGVSANPVFVDNPSLAQFQSGRNIRHLPCIVRKSGRSGVCMFAIDCIKQNGTHLGTCIDRFYFGSCCDIKEEELTEIADNSIDQNTISHHFTPESSTVPTSALFKLTTLGPLHQHGNTSFTSSSSISSSSSSTTGSSSSTSLANQQDVTQMLNSVTQTFATTTMNDTPRPTTLETNMNTGKPLKTTTTYKPSQQTTHKQSHFVIRTTAKPTKYTTGGAKPSHNTTTKKKTTPSSTTKRITTTTSTTTTTKRPMLTTTEATQQRDELPIDMTTTPTKLFTYQIVETTAFTPTEATNVFDFVTTERVQHKTTKPPTTSSSSTTTTTAPKATTTKPKDTTTSTTAAATTHKITTIKPKPQTTRKPTTTKKPTSIKRTTVKPTRRPIITTTTAAAITTISDVKTTNHTTSTTQTFQTSSTSQATNKTTLAPRPRPKPTASIVKVPKPTTTTTTKATTKPTTTTTTTTTTAPPRTTTEEEKIAATTTTTKKPTTPQTTTTTTSSTTKAPTTTTTLKVTTKPLLSSTTHKPGLVTWTNINGEPVDSNQPIISDWVPVTSEAPLNTHNKVEEPSSENVTFEEMDVSVSSSVSAVMNNTTVIISPPQKPISMAKPTTSSSSTTTSSTTETIADSSSTTAKPLTSTSEAPKQPELSSTTESSSSQFTTEGFTPSSSTISPTGFTTTEEVSTESVNLNSTTSAPITGLEGVDYRQVCGRRMFPEPRIVGGSNAAFGRWPWQISLRQWRTSTYLHKCGAALLNENWAITAAHCVDNVPPSDLLLRLGEYDLAEEEEPYGYQERRVQIVASHPQFDPRTFEYDLALLRFYEPVVFQPNIIPVCVPENDEDFIGQTAFVTGWGRLYEDGPLPSVLQEVAVPVINNTICESMYRAAGYIEHIPHIFICAGWKKGGYDSCEGDSGGPMVLQRESDKRFQLGGVISWGIGCAEANQPGVYTRISEFRDWINQILQF
ncbi:serine proteinase stubble [Lucilia sericata]|uniref:serine proteinase stubble n=1 Tax=Lucilia sericata TaxID=13632 RepID=UPI0018A82106|nr:serine proteinase stubble [Lucilia sericata]